MRYGGKGRGQSSIELLIILAVGLIVIGIVFSISQERLGSSQQVLAFSVAKNSVATLARAADAVYYEGIGARRQVRFTLPEGTVGSSISKNTVNIRIASGEGHSDASANTKAQLCPNSNLPTKPDSYMISLESLESCVLIGEGSNLSVSTTLIYENTNPNSTRLHSLNYSNLGAMPILVNLNLTFESTDMLVAFANPTDLVFTLGAGEQKEVMLKIDALPTAQGSHSGTLRANGSNGDVLETSIIVEAASGPCVQQCTYATPVSFIEIRTFSSDSYSQRKEIFDPSEEIIISGSDWDPNSEVILDLRDPADSYSLPNYPKVLIAGGSGAFSDSLLSGGLLAQNGYIIRASGTLGGIPKIKTANFNILACT